MFIVTRASGKIVGAWLGGVVSHSDKLVQRWIGLAMLPQAGVPIGMALVAANEFPQYRQILLSVMISTTIIFELFGPVFTRIALSKYKEGSK